MDQELLGLRQDVVTVQGHLAGVTEVLHQLGGFRMHPDIAEQPDLEHAGEHVAGDRLAAALFRGEQPVVLLGQLCQLRPRNDVPADQPEQDLAVEQRKMGRHLGDEALRDRRRAARDLGAHRLARPAARVDCREVAADEHDVARPANGVADPERDHVLLVAGALVHDPGGVLPEEAHPRIPGVGVHESTLALHLDVLADDLDQVLARVLQVQGRAGKLQAQRIAEESPLEHLLADRDENLDVVVDRMQVTRRQRDAHLREVPITAIDRPLLLGVDQVAC